MNTTVGIDIGSNQIRIIVAVKKKGSRLPKIIARGFALSNGMRNGYITNPEEVQKSLSKALSQAKKTSGGDIDKAYVSFGGLGLEAVFSEGTSIISRADSEVTSLEIERAIEKSEKSIPSQLSLNRKILHTIPVEFKLDGNVVLGRPAGMKGNKLEIRTFFITALSQQLNDLIAVVEEAGIEIEDVVASPMASSLSVLTKTQKIVGCVLADIGAETTTISIFENSIPVHLRVFPIGSDAITHDLALGLKITLDEAEELKRGGIMGVSFSKKKIDEIIQKRLKEIFNMIENELEKIGKNRLLPGGIIITGGGSEIQNIQEIARDILELPSKRAVDNYPEATKDEGLGPDWTAAYGLCILGFTENANERPKGLKLLANTGRWISDKLKQFLP